MLNRLKKMDVGILTLLVCFMVVSAVLLYSVGDGDPKYAGYYKKMLQFYVAGYILVTFVTLVDYRIILKFWYYFYAIGIAMLVAVFFLGSKVNGATGWFKLPGGFSFQPAEAFKIIMIIVVAYMLGRRQGDKLLFTQDLMPIAVLVGLPFMLVVVQPDLGNAVIYLVILLGMLWIGNVKYSHVLIGLVSVIGGAILFVTLFTSFNAEIKDYAEKHGVKHWYERINTFVDPTNADKDQAYQARNAKIAVGSGGLTGDGFLQGDSKNRGAVPYTYSDSIFVVIGEEFGFQGSAVLLLLYFLLIYRMIIIAFQCLDLKGSFIIIGVVCMYVFQVFQNVGMMIGIMPITGITLPFVSYGGTSLMLNMLSIGIVFSVRAHQEKYQLE
ncbi:MULTISPECIES: FtsW/RodA/SpoVE family cell cycle protein [unclassified Paenibacillus]|uniref:FtsW/RodA/SpoVE family cell cycle protein n=1 Tax=unclassified Paenibacillus TaxID=185978 RepID=UPI0009556D2C|nr:MULTISPECIES: FtsW/RodA/SpoVE family cell cycle protein [unclassified Paenibacillus]ASS66327.1 rod shape-determining protein RodA [Paenibacillus sp. RUD330]SIQ07703.1 rod shape determining protein RodA [Paenibacillus sp. RU4X]SIQ27787.1 rod shape determining protein RodA [Paenibacillus sp. RU4T]